MNIHEYQAKELLKRYGVAVLDGHVAWTPDEAVGGGRKAARPGLRGEVADPCRRPRRRPFRRRPERQGRRAPRPLAEEVRAAAEAMIGHTLVTKQTGPAGTTVHRVYVEAGCDIARELYLSLLVDRATSRVTDHGLHRRRHGDRGGRRASTRRRSCAWRSIRRPAFPASMRRGLAFGLGLTRQAGRRLRQIRRWPCTRRSSRWIARSSRSTRWW